MTSDSRALGSLSDVELHVLARAWAQRADGTGPDGSYAAAVADAYGSELLQRGDVGFALDHARVCVRTHATDRALAVLEHLGAALIDPGEPSRLPEPVRAYQSMAEIAAEAGELAHAQEWAVHAMTQHAIDRREHDAFWPLTLVEGWEDRAAAAAVLISSLEVLDDLTLTTPASDDEPRLVSTGRAVALETHGALLARTTLEIAKALEATGHPDDASPYIDRTIAAVRSPGSWNVPGAAAAVWREVYGLADPEGRRLLRDLGHRPTTEQELVRDVYAVADGSADENTRTWTRLSSAVLDELPYKGSMHALLLESLVDAQRLATAEPDAELLAECADDVARGSSLITGSGASIAADRLLRGTDARDLLKALAHLSRAHRDDALSTDGIEPFLARATGGSPSTARWAADFAASMRGLEHDLSSDSDACPGSWAVVEALLCEQLVDAETDAASADALVVRAVECWVDAAVAPMAPTVGDRLETALARLADRAARLTDEDVRCIARPLDIAQLRAGPGSLIATSHVLAEHLERMDHPEDAERIRSSAVGVVERRTMSAIMSGFAVDDPESSSVRGVVALHDAARELMVLAEHGDPRDAVRLAQSHRVAVSTLASNAERADDPLDLANARAAVETISAIATISSMLETTDGALPPERVLDIAGRWAAATGRAQDYPDPLVASACRDVLDDLTVQIEPAPDLEVAPLAPIDDGIDDPVIGRRFDVDDLEDHAAEPSVLDVERGTELPSSERDDLGFDDL